MMSEVCCCFLVSCAGCCFFSFCVLIFSRFSMERCSLRVFLFFRSAWVLFFLAGNALVLFFFCLSLVFRKFCCRTVFAL